MARSKNYKRKNVRSLRKSRRYKHLNGGGLVTITLDENRDKRNRQYFSITYRPPLPANQQIIIYIIFEKNLSNYKTWLKSTPNVPTGDDFITENVVSKTIPELVKYILQKKIPAIPLNNAIELFVKSNKQPTKSIFGMFGDNNNSNMIGLLNELKKELIPILDTNRQLQCVKDRLIYTILQIKNPDISTEITTIRDDIWRNAIQKGDPNNKVRSITQNCDAAVNALKFAPPSSVHISSELKQQMDAFAQEKKSFEEERIKAAENARIQQAKKEADEKKTAEISRAIQECELKYAETIKGLRLDKSTFGKEIDSLKAERDQIKRDLQIVQQVQQFNTPSSSTNIARGAQLPPSRWPP